MPRYICKVMDGETAYYLEYSTICDAPVTFGLSLDEFRDYYRDEYGESGMRDLDGRMKRVEEKGTSSHLHDNVEEVMTCNRAGKKETCLSMAQIVEWYCRRKDDQNLPWGKRYNEKTDAYEDVPEKERA